jgi:sulfate transport system permease protein
MAAKLRLVQHSPLPGFGLSLGAALLWLCVLVLVPLGALVLRASEVGAAGIAEIALQPRVFAALRLSFSLSLAAAALNVVLGGIVAWVLTRYEFPGRKFFDAAVDLPFALPTAVAGIALTAIYAPNGWLGAPLATVGVKVAFAPLGIFVALMFIGLPFVVRTVEPVLADLDFEMEEASATLGGGRFKTILHVVLPSLIPALLTGFVLAFARAVGEYGSVIFIAGNIPFVSEIAPLLIVVRLEEFDIAGATTVAVVMLALSFSMLLAVNCLRAWFSRRLGHGFV